MSLRVFGEWLIECVKPPSPQRCKNLSSAGSVALWLRRFLPTTFATRSLREAISCFKCRCEGARVLCPKQSLVIELSVLLQSHYNMLQPTFLFTRANLIRSPHTVQGILC